MYFWWYIRGIYFCMIYALYHSLMQWFVVLIVRSYLGQWSTDYWTICYIVELINSYLAIDNIDRVEGGRDWGVNPIAYGMIGTFQDRWCSLIIIKLQFVYQKYRLTGAMQDQYTDWAAEMPPSISKCSKNNSISLSKPSAKQSCSCSNIKVNFPQNSFLISDIWIVFFVKLKK